MFICRWIYNVSYFFFLMTLRGKWNLSFCNQGQNPRPLHWKCRDLTTGPRGSPSLSWWLTLQFFPIYNKKSFLKLHFIYIVAETEMQGNCVINSSFSTVMQFHCWLWYLACRLFWISKRMGLGFPFPSPINYEILSSVPVLMPSISFPWLIVQGEYL